MKNKNSIHKKNKQKRKARGVILWSFFIIIGFMILMAIVVNVSDRLRRDETSKQPVTDDEWPALDVQLLTPNPYSRPQIQLSEISGIVIHYTANPGATAQANRDYFEGLQNGDSGTHVSSHFIIGLDGEIIQCIPSTEISYASNDRNTDTLSIECCHPDETGRLNDETYQSLVTLTSWLCVHFDVDPDQVIRHYDITGKNCPKYFVEHEEAWWEFIQDIKNAIQQ